MKRIVLFDLLKGIAIFMVVMGHILTMCIRDIDSSGVFKVIGEVHMPLFFFISGWFTYKAGADGKPVAVNYYRRALQLLIPMLALSSLWIYWFPITGLESPLVSTWQGLWSSPGKNGYWFTPVLFIIMLVYGVFRLLPGMRPGVWRPLLCLAVFSVILGVIVSYIPEQVRDYGSLDLVARYFPAFGFGAVAAMHRQKFIDFCCRGWVIALSLVVSIVLIRYVAWYWLYVHNVWSLNAAAALMHISLAITAVGVFSQWSSTDTPAVRLWAFMGRKSLTIYLLHYFFLFPMGALRPALLATDLGIVPLLAVSSITAAAVCACALGAGYVLSRSKPLSFLFLGQ